VRRHLTSKEAKDEDGALGTGKREENPTKEKDGKVRERCSSITQGKKKKNN